MSNEVKEALGKAPSQESINHAWHQATQRYQNEVRTRLVKLLKPKLTNDFCDLALANIPYAYEPETDGEPIGWDKAPVSMKADAVLNFIKEGELAFIRRMFLPFVMQVLCEMVDMKPSEVLYFDRVPFYIKQMGGMQPR
jgi:hypothetical protein